MLGGLRFEVSHPFAINHPTDEDRSAETPGRRTDGARGFWGEPIAPSMLEAKCKTGGDPLTVIK